MLVLERSDPMAEPLAFFKSLHRAFSERLVDDAARTNTIDGLLNGAFENFERGVESTMESSEVACHGGCASCCTIRVTATAPEILLMARYIRSSPKTMEFELKRRIALVNDATRRMDEAQRMEQGIACPFIDCDLCVLYSVRPLACRGHASFDIQACVDALAGYACDVPISAAHMTVRSLVQNAMQSALRDFGYAWATYELNQALDIALSDDECETRWLNGEDIFAPALVADVSTEEMAEAFDAIKANGL